MTPRRLLVVDDDRLLCQAIRDRLGSEALAISTVHTAAEALAACAETPFDVVVLDQRLPDGEGSALCARLREASEATRIVFVTAYPSFDHAVRALKAGAQDYLCKPFELDELALVVERCFDLQRLQKVERLQDYQAARAGEEATLVGALPALREVLARATQSTAAVLITGETGTGKNLVARAIHYGGARRAAPLVGVNCAALPEHLIEAELLGWERGAFTGAAAARAGVAEMADGGTLFLDEVGELPLHLQAKLLSLIEEKHVQRLGGRTSRPVDVRIIAATNAPLEERVAAGTFRADLYYRLDVLRVRLPALREHPEDLPALCAHLLRRMAGCAPVPAFAPGELERLQRYPWPGNVRELRNLLERALVLHRDPLRPSEYLAPAPAATTPRPALAPAPAAATPSPAPGAVEPLEAVERRHVLAALEAFGGNLARTARALEISISTLKRKLRAYGSPRVSLAPGAKPPARSGRVARDEPAAP